VSKNCRFVNRTRIYLYTLNLNLNYTPDLNITLTLTLTLTLNLNLKLKPLEPLLNLKLNIYKNMTTWKLTGRKELLNIATELT